MFGFNERLCCRGGRPGGEMHGHGGPRRGHGPSHGRRLHGGFMPEKCGSASFDAAAGQCPICDKHCSLNEPGCGRGAAFAEEQRAVAAEGEQMLKDENPNSSRALTFLLHNALRRIGRAHHMRGHARHGQQRVLALLAERAPISQRDLLEELDVRSSSLSELLAKLERGGLIERERDEADRRNFIVKLSEAGLAAAQKSGEGEPGADSIFSALTEEEREQLGSLLRKLNDSLAEEMPEDAEGPHGRERGFHFHGPRGGRRTHHGRNR